MEWDSAPTHRLSQFIHPADGGRRYRIFRAEPTEIPPPAGFPVLYLLDGNAAFAALTPALLGSVSDLIVIGVGYETDDLFSVRDRWLDYTPPLGPDGPIPDPYRPDRLAGGADRFLISLTGDLRRAAEAGLPVDPRRRCLWGHSFGGLCVLYALFSRPAAFSGYVPVSPSLWWGDGVMERLEAAAVARPAPPASVLIMLGDRESRVDQPAFFGPGPAKATLALIARLRTRCDLVADARILEGMGHGPALATSLPFALRQASGGKAMSSPIPQFFPGRG